ncbi:MAG: response regulator transcription factor [Planctomycetaceae bacterium]|nr:response regulator transcription factor [Planctomycetaceae bacterium]MBT6496646.1 response regulator transcription factor [Planctomycetaceae bacterium]
MTDGRSSNPAESDSSDSPVESDADPAQPEPQATVFVVDDEIVVRDSLRWLIESVGLPVRTFSSGSEFLDAYSPRMAGCAILDVRMPGISGLDLQETLRERGATIPIILITGYADVPMAVRAMKSGATEFLRKPFSDQQMLDIVQRAIDDDAKYRKKNARLEELRQRLKSLTPRECEILVFVSDGLASREIGENLNISQKTVETHRTNMMKKMQVSNVALLTRLYLEAQVSSD